MIHVKYLTRFELEQLCFDKPNDINEEGILYRAFCTAKKSEAEAYEEVRLCSGQVPADDNAEYYIAPLKDRHSNCSMCKSGPMGDAHGNLTKPIPLSLSDYLDQAVDLSVLGTCRELYRECHEIFWKTNTFSFEDPKSWTKFMVDRILVEKRKIQRIHISMEVSIDLRRETHNDPYFSWKTKATVPRLTKPFNNLHILYLSITQCSFYDHKLVAMIPSKYLSHEDSQRTVTDQIESILALRLLPLKQVTVVISDDNTTKAGLMTDRWTKSQKCDLAEKLRGKLTDPHAAQMHEADMKAVKEEKERAIEKKARAYIRKLQDDLDEAQAKADASEPSTRFRSVIKLDRGPPSRRFTVAKLVAAPKKEVDYFNRLQDKADKLRERIKELQENPVLAQGQSVRHNPGDMYYSD